MPARSISLIICSPSAQPVARVLFAAKPIRANVFLVLLRRTLSVTENLGRIAMGVAINDHNDTLSYAFHLILRPGAYSQAQSGRVRRLVAS